MRGGRGGLTAEAGRGVTREAEVAGVEEGIRSKEHRRPPGLDGGTGLANSSKMDPRLPTSRTGRENPVFQTT